MSQREIKFRAWEKNLKEMIPVHDVDFERKIINTSSAWRFLNEVALMQYTGLKDKNGKEIYEGDVIKSIRGYKAVVEWVDDGRFLGFTIERERKIMYVGQEPAVEVIGNIYESPELLEVVV